MIYLYTHVYNAKQTLPQTIESILNQTSQKFVWILCDNASTDNTREIILKYAEKDHRIIPELRDMNHLNPNYKGIQLFWLSTLYSILEKGNDNDFFCTIDADDAYKPDCFKNMLEFADQNVLDVVACGSDFINATNGLTLSSRKLNQNLILESIQEFGTYFGQYHQFMRPVWGKLFRFSLLKQCDYKNYIENIDIAYGLDTLFSMRTFLRAKRVGILSEPLHKYYVSHGSSSYNFEKKRIYADQFLDDETRSFLIEKTGNISPENEDFLQGVYYNAVKDTLIVLLKSNISTEEKLIHLKGIVSHEKNQFIFLRNEFNRYDLEKIMCTLIISFLLGDTKCKNPGNIDSVAQIIMAMYMELHQLLKQEDLKYLLLNIPNIVEPLVKAEYDFVLERLQKWYKRHDADNPSLTQLEINVSRALGKPVEELFTLLSGIHKNRPQSSKALGVSEQIGKLFEPYPLLTTVGADLACVFPAAIRWVMREEYGKALDALLSKKNIEIKEKDTEEYLMLGQNLSAAAENAEQYIQFKKRWISYLIESSRYLEARKELYDFLKILPDDEDFITLKKKLMNVPFQ